MREEGPTKAQTSALLGDVQARYQGWQHAQKLMAPLLAPDFSPFDAQRNLEIEISRYLALLLDPEGTHGQGRLFWDGFVALVLEQQGALQQPLKQHGSTACEEAPPLPDLRTAHMPVAASWLAAPSVKHVQREHYTRNGRYLDLFVQLQGGCVGIENKPWRHSRDGKLQLAAYATYLQSLYGSWMLVYLGHQVPDPSSLPEEKRKELIRNGHFVYLLWPEVLEWLRASLARIQAQKVRWFVEELCNYLQRHIGSDLPEAAMNHIAEAFTATPQALDSAFQIRNSLTDWQNQRLEQLRQQLKAATKGKYSFNWKVTPTFREAHFTLEVGWGPNLYLYFEWGNLASNPGEFYWGLHFDKQMPEAFVQTMRHLIKQQLNVEVEERQDEWPCYVYVHKDPLFVPKEQQERQASKVLHPWLTLGAREDDFVTLVLKRHEGISELMNHADLQPFRRKLTAGGSRTPAA